MPIRIGATDRAPAVRWRPAIAIVTGNRRGVPHNAIVVSTEDRTQLELTASGMPEAIVGPKRSDLPGGPAEQSLGG